MQKTLPSAKKTKKKFYNKYIYKITLDIPGTSALRWYDFQQLSDLCIAEPSSKRDYPWREKVLGDAINHKEVWIDLSVMINTFDSKSFSKRIEGDSIDFYTNNYDLYDTIGKHFSKYVRFRFQPKEGTEQTLLNSNKEIFVNKLPYDKYQYRVYLKPHKLDRAARRSVANWMEKQVPNITFSKSIKDWIIRTEENWDRRYIHIIDEKNLLLLRLKSPQLVGKIFKYVLNR